MSFDEVKEMVRRVSYKPGITLTVVPGQPGCADLIIHTCAPDSEQQSHSLPLTATTHFCHDTMDRNQFIRFVFGRIRDWEIHETQEFFRVDGRRVFDPHESYE